MTALIASIRNKSYSFQRSRAVLQYISCNALMRYLHVSKNSLRSQLLLELNILGWIVWGGGQNKNWVEEECFPRKAKFTAINKSHEIEIPSPKFSHEKTNFFFLPPTPICPIWELHFPSCPKLLDEYITWTDSHFLSCWATFSIMQMLCNQY